MIEALKHARIKGEILKRLKAEYHHPIDFIILRKVLATLGFPLMVKELAAYLHYLEEAGYTRLVRDNDLNIMHATITVKGLNLVDKIITDPAIEVD